MIARSHTGRTVKESTFWFARNASAIGGKANWIEGDYMDFGNKAYSEIADLANDLGIAANRAFLAPNIYPDQKVVVESIVQKISERLKALPE